MTANLNKSRTSTAKATYVLLLRHTRVERTEDLAPLWRRLANAAKAEQQTVIHQELTNVCVNRGLAPELYSPVVSTTIKQMITGFTFAGIGPNELAAGCSPFLVAYTGARALQEAQDLASTTQQLEQGSQNASLADIRAIKEKERIRFPRDLHHVGITLQRYAVLLQCLFQGVGAPHPLVSSVWTLAEDFRTKLPFLLESHQNLSREHHDAYLQLPVRVLRYVQVVAIEYFQRVASAHAGFGEVDDPPRFRDMIQDLQWGTFHVSRNWIALPPHYALLAFPPAQATPSSGGGGRRGTQSVDTMSTTTTSASGVSTLTAPSAAVPAGKRQTQIPRPMRNLWPSSSSRALGNYCDSTVPPQVLTAVNTVSPSGRKGPVSPNAVVAPLTLPSHPQGSVPDCLPMPRNTSWWAPDSQARGRWSPPPHPGSTTGSPPCP